MRNETGKNLTMPKISNLFGYAIFYLGMGLVNRVVAFLIDLLSIKIGKDLGMDIPFKILAGLMFLLSLICVSVAIGIMLDIKYKKRQDKRNNK